MNKVLILGTSSFGGAATADFLLSKKFFVLGTYRRRKNPLYQPQTQNLKKKILKTLKLILTKTKIYQR